MKELGSVSMFVLLLILGITFSGCDLSDQEAVDFSMQVIPENIEGIPGQSCVFLVAVEDEGYHAHGQVNISGTVEGGKLSVNIQAIAPGQVAEVTVIPDELLVVNGTLTLTATITGEREGLQRNETVSIAVSGAAWPDELLPTAILMRRKFVPWLAANYPESGITTETNWIGIAVRTRRVFQVSYYLFFSDQWEMGLRWHVTIPPHDWAEMYLRHRTTETVPSHGFKITSWILDAADDPQIISPPESVWR